MSTLSGARKYGKLRAAECFSKAFQPAEPWQCILMLLLVLQNPSSHQAEQHATSAPRAIVSQPVSFWLTPAGTCHQSGGHRPSAHAAPRPDDVPCHVRVNISGLSVAPVERPRFISHGIGPMPLLLDPSAPFRRSLADLPRRRGFDAFSLDSAWCSIHTKKYVSISVHKHP